MSEREPTVDRSRLSELYLEVDGDRYEASSPQWGDATLGEPDLPGSAEVAARAEEHDHVSIGMAADEIARLHAPISRAVLKTRDGKEVLSLRIDKVSPEFGVIIGTPLVH